MRIIIKAKLNQKVENFMEKIERMKSPRKVTLMILTNRLMELQKEMFLSQLWGFKNYKQLEQQARESERIIATIEQILAEEDADKK